MSACSNHRNGKYTCGRCDACRGAHARVWTARLLMEAQHHLHTAFVTLTYNDDFLPSVPELARRQLQLYFKRLRKSVAFRYYGATERGELNGRLHHHLLLFGLPYLQQEIVDAWNSQGMVASYPAADGSHAYVAGYVLKKVMGDDRIRPLMSLKPGIGLGQVQPLARQLDSRKGHYVIEQLRDVPSSLDFGGKTLPLGQTFKRKLRMEVLGDPHTPFEAQEMSHLRSLQEGAPLPGSPEAVQIKEQKSLNASAKIRIQLSKRKL